LLDLIAESIKKDIRTLEAIQKEIEGAESTYAEIPEMLDVLRDQETKATELRNRFHEADLPPIRSANADNETSPSQNSSNNFPQDSSDVHQTDFNPFDPFGEE